MPPQAAHEAWSQAERPTTAKKSIDRTSKRAKNEKEHQFLEALRLLGKR